MSEATSGFDLDASPAGNGAVLLWLSDRGATILASRVGALLQALSDDRVAVRGRGHKVLSDERLFPDAYPRRADSEGFRTVHGAEMRARLRGAAERVRHQCRPGEVIVLDPQAVAAWFMVLAHAQTPLCVRRRWQRHPDRWMTSAAWSEVHWLAIAQHLIARAVLGIKCLTCVRGCQDMQPV